MELNGFTTVIYCFLKAFQLNRVIPEREARRQRRKLQKATSLFSFPTPCLYYYTSLLYGAEKSLGTSNVAFMEENAKK